MENVIGHTLNNDEIDPQKSLEFLKKEWNTAKTSTGECCGTPSPVCEYIGNGMYRMHLQALSEGLSPETMNQMFLQSAANKKGTMESFEKKLEQFLEWCRMGELPFDKTEAEEYLKEYQKNGYPAVSHSLVYKKAYHPAYRVIEERFVQYYPVLCCIDRAMKERQNSTLPNSSQLLVAIDGMCGSGKTTLGRLLQSVYDCNLFHMDDFFLRPEQRTPERMAQVGGNVDYERFQEEILNHICQQEGLSYRIYNCKSQTLGSILKNWDTGKGFSFDLLLHDNPTLMGTEMWLSILYLLCDYVGLADCLSYQPQGVHRLKTIL